MSESVLEALCVLPSSVAVLLEKVARSLRPIAGTRRRYHHPRTRFQPTTFTACSQITRFFFRSAIVLPRDFLSFSILLRGCHYDGGDFPVAFFVRGGIANTRANAATSHRPGVSCVTASKAFKLRYEGQMEARSASLLMPLAALGYPSHTI